MRHTDRVAPVACYCLLSDCVRKLLDQNVLGRFQAEFGWENPLGCDTDTVPRVIDATPSL